MGVTGTPQLSRVASSKAKFRSRNFDSKFGFAGGPKSVLIIAYSPKESALALTVWVPLVRVALISLVYWFQIFTTLRTVTFIWWAGGREGRIFGSNFDFFQCCLEVV